MMSRRVQLRQIPEVLLALLGWLLIPCLPRRAVTALAKGLGTAAWVVSPGLRRISDANLRIVFGDESGEAWRRETGKRSFQGFALTMLDMFWFMRHKQRRIERFVRVDPSFMPVLQAAPWIAVTAHFGNWELMSAVCGLRGAPVTAVVMPLANVLVDRLLSRLRRTADSVSVPRRGAVRALLKSLKEGRTVGLVLDQNTLPREGGIWVPFFGLPVPVSNAAGSLWQRTGIRVIAVVCEVDGDGVYTMSASAPFPVPGDPDPTAEDVTRRATRCLEDIIRRRPAGWLWSYKRWKYFRAEDPVDRYPFYAKTFNPGQAREPGGYQSGGEAVA